MNLMQLLSEQAALINAEGIPWVLRLVMIGLGLSLTVQDFMRIVLMPKAVTIGLVAQLLALPATAFGLSLLFGVPPEIAVGLVILAACPSGVTANAYSFAARADVPLCVTLSALTSVITVFSIPFLVDFALSLFMAQGQMARLPVGNMFLSLVTYTLLPLSIGMMIRSRYALFAKAAVEPIRKVVLYLMIFVLLLGIVSSYETVLQHLASAGAVVVTMNLLTMGLGYGLARFFKLGIAQVVTITFEVGVQNLALAFAITFTILRRPELAVAPLIYAVVMPATALGFVVVARRMLVRSANP